MGASFKFQSQCHLVTIYTLTHFKWMLCFRLIQPPHVIHSPTLNSLSSVLSEGEDRNNSLWTGMVKDLQFASSSCKLKSALGTWWTLTTMPYEYCYKIIKFLLMETNCMISRMREMEGYAFCLLFPGIWPLKASYARTNIAELCFSSSVAKITIAFI